MIESAFCKVCWRPYAMAEVEICDSCMKTLRFWKKKMMVRIVKRYFVKDLVRFILEYPDDRSDRTDK